MSASPRKEKLDDAMVADLRDASSSDRGNTDSESAGAVTVPKPGEPGYDYKADFPDIDEKKLYRKIDLALIPWLSFLYLLSFLDRTAIGNAKLFGLRETLGMTPTQLNICTSMFFITYAIFEVPSNILLKRLKPSVWFPLITCVVGVCMLSQGVVSNYGGLLVARLALGVAEAGLFPGVNYLLSGWYPRRMFGIRAAIFFSAATASGAFGGLLSVALSKMNGVGGYEGWRWIFIIIGLITFVAGVMSIWLVENFPTDAKFLSERERAFIIAKLQSDQQFSAAGEEFQWAHLWKGLTDLKTWVASLAYAGADGPLYSFSIFTPTIVKELGYSSIRANLISVPIYVFACLVTLAVGFTADRKGKRGLINVIMLSIGVTGYIILIASRLPGLSYFAIYLAAAGIYPCIPNTVALTATSIEGAYKRSVVSAFVISFGNINGAATTNVYLPGDAPWYTLGHGLIVMWLGIGIISNVVYVVMLRHDNAQKARGNWDETILDHLPEEEAKVQAAAAREKEMEQAGFFGRLRRRVHEGPGGTYASVAEAKSLKGDAYSGFVYSY